MKEKRIKYTATVGSKFNKDGSVRAWPGMSIICFLTPDMPQYKLLTRFQEDFKLQPFAGCFTMLPPKSFHMTIIDLLCNLARTPEHWSSKLPLDTEYPVIKKKINGWLKDLLPQKNIRVKFENLTDYNVTVKSLVKPADIKSKTLINKFRETTILATGARHPGHKIYAFHISMAYIIRFLSADEEKSVNDFLRSWQEIFVREFGIVEFGPPQLVFFPNMHQFSVK